MPCWLGKLVRPSTALDANFFFFDTLCRGSAVGKIVGYNVARHSDLFEPQVKQWVFEEMFNGEKLTDIINREHENPKYDYAAVVV